MMIFINVCVVMAVAWCGDHLLLQDFRLYLKLRITVSMVMLLKEGFCSFFVALLHFSIKCV
jgi:hypothetical protein